LSHNNPVRYASFSRDGRTVITACSEDNLVSSTRSDIYLWDASSGRRINHSPMSQAFFLLYAAFSRDNRRILTCGFNFTARVWDANSGEPLTPPLRHKEQIRWGAFSPDGRQVVTASWDRTARVWDATTGNPITPPLQHSETVVGAFWSEDGKRLSTLTKDDRLQVWDLQTGEPLTPPRRVGDQPSQFSETLPMDNRPVKDLVQLAQMLSVGKIDADGNVVPLQLQELKSEWQTLHEKYPAQFSAAPTEIAAWHQRQARESASEGNERAEKFHLAMMAQAGAAIGSYEPSPPPSRFPPHDTATPRQQIDLSAFYNEGLHDSGGYDFGDLRPGPFEAGGVEFDLRGMVLLDGQKARRQKAGLPVRANGIRIGQKCRRLHFIQATDWAPLLNGAQIATYILHYADGGTRELPVIYGKHTAGMWVWSLFGMATPCQPMSEAIPAWTGHNVNALRSDCALWLYKSDRDNPRPDVELSSVDVVSTMSEASPLLAALTIE
jgi:WD40 repeat protein